VIDIGKLLMGVGAVLLVLGAAAWILGRLGFRGLPGDIRYQSQHVHVYFPIVTCIVISVLMTLVAWLWQWISKR
jgi:Na+/phosphate symporter